MKKGEIYEGTVERVDYMNRGRTYCDGTEVTVKNTIPGQKIRYMISKKRAGRAEGRLLEVLEKSPQETREPLCGIFPECGGCLYQTMSYESQLEMKERQIRSLLSPFLEEAAQDAWEGIYRSPLEFSYRNKMEYSFGDASKDGPLTLGLHRRSSSYDVLTADNCILVHPDMNRILSCVLLYTSEKGWPFYKKNSHTGYLRHLLLRRGSRTGEILVHLVTSSQEEHDLTPLVQSLLGLSLDGSIAGILHIINDSPADTIQSDETRILWGRDYYYDELFGLRFRISTFSFFQPNTCAAEVLYSKVREYLGDEKRQVVYDLYSGTGTISQVVAPTAKKVLGIEIVEEAVEAAKRNAQENGLDNCEFIAGDVLKELDRLTEKPDFIILDPPREGIHPKALPKILSLGTEKIIYISCKATSLVRDLPGFHEAGYRITKACCIDQFVHTPHIETIVLLQRVN